jgi:hypothetical protein
MEQIAAAAAAAAMTALGVGAFLQVRPQKRAGLKTRPYGKYGASSPQATRRPRNDDIKMGLAMTGLK